MKVRLVLRTEQGVSRRYRVARYSQIRLNISHSPGLHGLFPVQLVRASTDSTHSQQSSNMQQLCDDNFPVDRDYGESAFQRDVQSPSDQKLVSKIEHMKTEAREQGEILARILDNMQGL